MISSLRIGYLLLAIWGAVHPMMYYFRWSRENGSSLAGLSDAWQANAATSGLAWGLTISSIALTLWAVGETRVRRNWSALWAIPATFLIGVGCGLPLYLFLRTRPVA